MSRIDYKNILTLRFTLEALNRDLKLIFFSNLIGAFGDGLYFYILPLHMEELGAGSVEVGILFSALGLAAAFTPLLGGFLADKYDRKKVMILGWLIWLPTPIILSLAENWSQLLPGMILYGCWIGQPASSAYIATAAEKDKMTLAFTTISASWSLGYIFSPALGGYLSTLVGMKRVFWLSFVFYALCTFGLFFISGQHATRRPSQTPAPTPFRKKKIVIWAVFFAAIMFVITLARPFVTLFLKDELHFNRLHIGVLGSVTFLGSAILAVTLGRLGDKWRKAGAVSVSIMLVCASFIGLLFFRNFFALVFPFFLMGATYMFWSLMGAVVGSMAPEASRGRWMSVSQTTCMLAAILAPYLGGILYDASPHTPFIVAVAATPLLSILALSKLLKED